jgi:hypothetical protein
MSAREWRAAREGDTRSASRKHSSKTPENFIVGVGASGALLAGAAIVFVTLVGVVSFNFWPSSRDFWGDGSIHLGPPRVALRHSPPPSPLSAVTGQLASTGVVGAGGPAGSTGGGGGGGGGHHGGVSPGKHGASPAPAAPPQTPPQTPLQVPPSTKGGGSGVSGNGKSKGSKSPSGKSGNGGSSERPGNSGNAPGHSGDSKGKPGGSSGSPGGHGHGNKKESASQAAPPSSNGGDEGKGNGGGRSAKKTKQ